MIISVRKLIYYVQFIIIYRLSVILSCFRRSPFTSARCVYWGEWSGQKTAWTYTKTILVLFRCYIEGGCRLVLVDLDI